MGGDGITEDEHAPRSAGPAQSTLMTYGPDPRNNPAAEA